ncbi:MAG: ROK family protein [Coprobacillus sp.]
MKNYLSIDVGGSSIKYGIVDEEANIIETESVKAPKTLEAMYQVFEDAFYKYKSYNIQGIALSMPGAVDSETGVIGGSSAHPYIHGPNIKQYLEDKLNVRVEMENDANCAALAEVWKGAGEDVDDCCFIVCGTGIGGAVVKDKRIHKGKHLHGGEFGYMIADFDYDTKEMQTWSTVGSTVAVLRAISKAKNVDIETLDGRDIFDHYHDDAVYEKYVDRFYCALANGIYNLQYAYDPEKIIIGGAISIRDDLLDEVNKRLDVIFGKFTHAKIKPVVLTCQYHNEANLIGALYHFLTKNS